MRLSLYSHERDSLAKVSDFTMESLLELLGKSRESEVKSGISWSPAEVGNCTSPCYNIGKIKRFDCGGGKPHRDDRNVLKHHLLVLDVDHADMPRTDRVLQALKESTLRAIVHSSHSHNPPDDCCLRAVLFPDRPILPSEVASVRANLIKALDLPIKTKTEGGVDSSTGDLSRLYYLPSHKPGHEPFFLHFGENSFEVDPLVTLNAPSPASDLGPTPIGVPGVRAAFEKSSVKELHAIAKGEAFAVEGERDATLNRVAWQIVRILGANLDIPTVLYLADPSLRALPGPEGAEHWREEFEDMLERAIEGQREQDARQAEANAQLKRDLAALKTGPAAQSDANGNYSQEALDHWAKERGYDSGKDLEPVWIVQKRKNFYLFHEGTYLARGAEDVQNSLHRVFQRAPLELTEKTKDGGVKPLTFANIFKRYGTVANDLAISLVEQVSYYNRRTGVFHEAPCPLRQITPEFNPQIQTWLELLGGPYKEKLLDWVATVTQLEHQTCAVSIEGPKDIGKSLFAHGLARLWTEGSPADADLVFADFNDDFIRCPLIFADERLPDRKDISADLRKLISATQRVVNRKFMTPTSVHGAVRLVIAANKDIIARITKDPSQDDLAAIAERFLCLRPGPEVQDYVFSIGGRATTSDWIYKDKLAAHALALAQSRTVKSGSSRLLVTGDLDAFREKLAVNSSSSLIEYIVKRLQKATQGVNIPEEQMLIGEGEVWCSTEVDAITWDNTIGDKVSVKQIARMLESISVGSRERVQITRSNKKMQVTYRRVRVPSLLSWAQANMVSDEEELKTLINRSYPVLREALERRGIKHESA